MDTVSYKTIAINKDTAEKGWVIVDASEQVLGRLCTTIAMHLRGKTKPSYTPNADCGDNVIVINAEKIVLTGKKWDDKEYVRHSGYPGGQRTRTPREVLERKPADIVENAVRGMLPKNRLGRELFRNLHVYIGGEHPHEAQKPKEIKL